jgi:hypothetical protein
MGAKQSAALAKPFFPHTAKTHRNRLINASVNQRGLVMWWGMFRRLPDR